MGIIGSKIINFNEIDSTNRFAEDLIKQGVVTEGTVIRAAYQSAGKGQGKNQWISEQGKNLLITIVLKPHFLAPDRQFQLNKALTLGLFDFISTYCHDVVIKWPNDIRANNKKIAGILIQHTVEGDQLIHTIAGIGLNVNQMKFPDDLPDAISLHQILGSPLDLDTALQRLCLSLDVRYSMLRAGNFKVLDADYHTNLMGIFEEQQFIVSGETIAGTIQGVDVFGQLLVEHENGVIKAYQHGEIEV